MTILSNRKYSFVSGALPEDTFSVVRFEGSEGLSRCYEFNLLLAAEIPDLDLEMVLEKTAAFTIHREDGDLAFSGILLMFEQHQEYDRYVFYRAVLVPRLFWLSQTCHNQVFLNMTLPDILKAVLQDGGLAENDFRLELHNEYPTREYVCQYRESHLAFISRWMERDGIYYYFDQTPAGEQVVITDSRLAHVAMPQGQTINYAPPSGLESDHLQEIVQVLVCSQQAVPEKIVLKDYNDLTPSLELTGQAQVSDRGQGEIYIYGEHFRTPEEGDALAAVRAEEYLCREREFWGRSMAPYIQSGYTFKLQGHYRDEYDQEYLTIEVFHEGSQSAYLTAGLQEFFPEEENKIFYKNSFMAIPARLQFRPPRNTEKSRFFGVMNAVIDGAGSGQYAELDEMGRYKILLPFDQSGRKDGKASAWLRMMQPYVGADHGLHFPLHKGAEVLLTFIDGDPDRPIIAGAVPNPDYPSPVTNESQTQCRLTTSGQNRIHMEDQEGSQRILAHSPTASSFVRIGAPNDPAPDQGGTWFDDADPKWFKPEKDGISLFSTQAIDVKASTSNKIVLGESSSTMVGADGKIFLGGKFSFSLAALLTFSLLASTKVKLGLHWKILDQVIEMRGFHRKLSAIETKIQDSTSRLRTEVTRVQGAASEAVAEAKTARGELTKVTGTARKAAGQLDRAAGKASEVKASVTRVSGSASWVKGRLNDVRGESTRVCASLTRAIEEEDSLMGTVEEAVQTRQEIVVTRQRVSAADVKV